MATNAIYCLKFKARGLNATSGTPITGPVFANRDLGGIGSEMRVWLWQIWQRGIGGVLIWQSNYWTSGAAYPDGLQNPYNDPTSWVSGYSTKEGVKQAWGNGDGRFLYPPQDYDKTSMPIIAGPVDSIRWEMLRDGIEDYEYLAMLRRALETKKLSPPRRAELEKLLLVPEEISKDATTFTSDPAPIETRRAALARALEERALEELQP